MPSSTFPVSNDPIGVRIVAAIGRRGELGFENRLAFRLKADMANFRKVTAKTPLVMGRKTWESFPKRPLPGRPNIVATRNLDFIAPGAFVFSSLPPALAAARTMAAQSGIPEVSIIGGAEIYAAGLDLATHHQRRLRGHLAEIGHVGLQPEQQPVFEAEFASPAYRGDDPDADRVIADGKGGRWHGGPCIDAQRRMTGRGDGSRTLVRSPMQVFRAGRAWMPSGTSLSRP